MRNGQTAKTAEPAFLETPSFVDDTAAKTGQSARTTSEEVQIATNLADDVKDIIRDTPLADTKTELLALARMPKEEQKDAATKIATGKAKSVKDAQGQQRKEKQRAREQDALDTLDATSNEWTVADAQAVVPCAVGIRTK